MMNEEQSREFRENVAALIAGLLICAAVAGYALILRWGVSACDGDNVKKVLLASNFFGCADYWLERYQTLFTGILSAAIALGAAYLVVRTLARMDQQNRVAEASLEQARLQFTQSERQAIANAGHTARSIANSISYTVLPVFPLLKVNTEREVMLALQERLPRIDQLMAEFRKSVAPYLKTKDEIDLHSRAEDRIGACAMYAAAHLAGINFDQFSDHFNTAQDLTEGQFSAVTSLIDASDDLHAIAKCLQERLNRDGS
jgi:hypothetical protein